MPEVEASRHKKANSAVSIFAFYTLALHTSSLSPSVSHREMTHIYQGLFYSSDCSLGERARFPLAFGWRANVQLCESNLDVQYPHVGHPWAKKEYENMVTCQVRSRGR